MRPHPSFATLRSAIIRKALNHSVGGRGPASRIALDTIMSAIERGVKRNRRPPEAGAAIPAIPPRGPLPLAGGAAAPFDFSAD